MNKDELRDVEENVIGFEALYDSMMKCKRNVMWKDSVAHYYLNAIEETIRLEEQLKKGTYKAKKPVVFTVTSPKRREIVSISFRDRIYQRSLNDNAIYPQMSKSFIYDNAACQKDKGTDFARRRLKCFLQRYYRKYGTNKGYVLQCDIHGYYPNMRHDVAVETFRRGLDPWTFEAAKKVLEDQYEGDTGYNPGSQMIQIAGISVLNRLDHTIKEDLQMEYYPRYMDDFLLVDPAEQRLEHGKERIEKELNSTGFELNEKKTRIYPLSKGIKYLGFWFYLTDTGKVVMLLDSKNVKRERKKLYRLVAKAKRGEITKEKVDHCYAGWRNHAEKGDSKVLLRNMDEYYNSLWKGVPQNAF